MISEYRSDIAAAAAASSCKSGSSSGERCAFLSRDYCFQFLPRSASNSLDFIHFISTGSATGRDDNDQGALLVLETVDRGESRGKSDSGSTSALCVATSMRWIHLLIKHWRTA